MQTDQLKQSYLTLGNYRDLPPGRDRVLYRFFEMLPGILIWATFALAIFLSRAAPVFVAFFILAFDLYWIFKIIYFSIHTRSAYKRMKEYMKRDWLAEVQSLPPRELKILESDTKTYNLKPISYRNLWHLVIVPMFKEPYDVVHPAIASIANSHWPKNRMILILATEESAGKAAQVIAEKIRSDFSNFFPNFFVTLHPQNLPGELAGKGANERWAGIWVKENFIDKRGIPHENIIVSSLDSDTVIYPHYFSCVAYHYLTAEKPLRSSYQPIPLFINNIWEAPALSRVVAFSSTFWHTMNQERHEKHLTFSSHSMPLKALVDIGFWQPNVVSEDSRIFWQCFLRYDGDYRVVSLYYPLNMDANVARSILGTFYNIYKQQRRWAYGAADIAYFLFGFLKNKKIKKSLMWGYGFYTVEGFFSWATHALLIFILGWLPIMLGGDAFNSTILSYSLPRITRTLLSIAMIGIMLSVFLSILILPPRPPEYGKWKYVLMALQWFLIPVTLIIFGAFPAIEAQTRLMLGKYMGFWPTEKFRK